MRKPEINMQEPVNESSQLRRIGHDEPSCTAVIEFGPKDRQPAVYHFQNVPQSLAESIRTAESAGSTFHRLIKSRPTQYPAHRVIEDAECDCFELPESSIMRSEAESILAADILGGSSSLPEAIVKEETRLIRMALTATEGHVTKAARILGISHQMLLQIIDHRCSDLQAVRAPKRRRGKPIVKNNSPRRRYYRREASA